MKFVIINGKDDAARKFAVLKKETQIDEESNNKAYIYTSVNTDEKHLLPFLKESYEMDDYDYFIWSVVSESDEDVYTDKIKKCVGVDDLDIEYIRY